MCTLPSGLVRPEYLAAKYPARVPVITPRLGLQNLLYPADAWPQHSTRMLVLVLKQLMKTMAVAALLPPAVTAELADFGDQSAQAGAAGEVEGCQNSDPGGKAAGSWPGLSSSRDWQAYLCGHRLSIGKGSCIKSYTQFEALVVQGFRQTA